MLPAAEREAGLTQWLTKYGHRGPLESDLARPRFHELREVLLNDLMSAPASTPAAEPSADRAPIWPLRPFFWIDVRREWFRDMLMRRWDRLRTRILAEASRLHGEGKLATPQDVFWLRPADLRRDESLAEAAARNRARVEAVKHLDLPTSAPRDVVQEILTRAAAAHVESDGRSVFPGIALHSAIVEGRVLKADDLVTLLQGADGEVLGPETILVVPTLEPSWAVVFPRVAGVVAELGGELSHASILLREARRPAIVNCAGIFRRVRNGDRLRLDGVRGLVEVLG